MRMLCQMLKGLGSSKKPSAPEYIPPRTTIVAPWLPRTLKKCQACDKPGPWLPPWLGVWSPGNMCDITQDLDASLKQWVPSCPARPLPGWSARLRSPFLAGTITTRATFKTKWPSGNVSPPTKSIWSSKTLTSNFLLSSVVLLSCSIGGVYRR